MILFPIVIIVSLVLFVYFKVFQSRARGGAQYEVLGARATMSLGIFVTTFGINSYINFQTTTAAVIGLIFTALGVFNIYHGVKRHKHFQPLAKEEKKKDAS
ncbi:YtpI family protein [Alkalicoccus chagannorensis]|uniref:YtpI family protein n=1 Tax=Alkalicoccus chagannorensis TaxID=427072 RepID=UPI000415BC1C|nr:YtpI family protein [Alkalicoccus chagannorensis]